MKQILLIIVFVLFTSTFSFAQNYADIAIDITSEGFVTITGDTNIDSLLVEESQIYTSKNGKYWLLNITLNQTFENLIYQVTLPSNSQITYMKTVGTIRIDENLHLVGTAKQKPLELLIQYTIVPKKYSYSWILILLIPFFAGIYLFVFKKKLKNLGLKIKASDTSHLPLRQQEIMTILMKHNGEMYQSKLEKEVTMPKSSLSRNLHSLQRSEYIEIKPSGMSNHIRIKKKDDS